jgi:hypothetical protein
MGRVAAGANTGHHEEGGDKEKRNETLDQLEVFSFHNLIIEPCIAAALWGVRPILPGNFAENFSRAARPDTLLRISEDHPKSRQRLECA